MRKKKKYTKIIFSPSERKPTVPSNLDIFPAELQVKFIDNLSHVDLMNLYFAFSDQVGGEELLVQEPRFETENDDYEKFYLDHISKTNYLENIKKNHLKNYFFS